ncbi:MAG: hypothetical protein VXZ18_19210, partial [Pseudomonadota bacterium]|nr:hypothetical protein [Pseudomonadota bacterium]
TQDNVEILRNLTNTRGENLNYQNSTNMIDFLNGFQQRNFRQMITGYFRNKLYVRPDPNYTCFYSIPNEQANGFVLGNQDDDEEEDDDDNDHDDVDDDDDDDDDDNDLDDVNEEEDDDDNDDEDNNDIDRMNVISNTCHNSDFGSVNKTGSNSSSFQISEIKRKVSEIYEKVEEEVEEEEEEIEHIAKKQKYNNSNNKKL